MVGVTTELAGERRVPDEVGGEVGAIPAGALIVNGAEVAIRRRHQERDEQQRERQRPPVRGKPGAKGEHRLRDEPGHRGTCHGKNQPRCDKRDA